MPSNLPFEDETHLLYFRVVNERYAIDLPNVAEVIPFLNVRGLPNRPEYSLGLQQYRGEHLEVFHLERAFGSPDCPLDEEGYSLVLTADNSLSSPAETTTSERRIGWWISDMDDLGSITPDDVDQSVSEPGIHGAVDFDGETYLWLSPQVVSKNEMGHD